MPILWVLAITASSGAPWLGSQRSSSPTCPLPPGPGELELRRAFRDVQDHVVRVSERTDSFRQLLNNMLTANATQVTQRQNEEITRLTEATYKQSERVKQISSWVAILFAPTLVGTVYGMNFTHMPELGWVFGYPLAVVLMILTGLVLRFVFKRRGWL
ncbi:MAG: CorA family divalent cation transporter [Pseudonocardiaceae bacterium]